MIPLWLASQSPRRLELLANAGFNVQRVPSGLDDGHLSKPPDMPIPDWTIHLARLKAVGGARPLRAAGEQGIVIGADTVVEWEGQVIGQPRGREHAGQIIRQLADCRHQVITGVTLIDLARPDPEAVTFADASIVDVGPISEASIESYLDSGAWQGKAGAYNLSERLEAGWPIEYQGDPTSIMGLPMDRLREVFHQQWGVRSA